MSRPSWGHVSRHCSRCGKVGPRIQLGLEWIHAYCRTPEEKKAERQRLREQSKKQAALIAEFDAKRKGNAGVPRNVTAAEDRMLRNAAKRSAKVVAPGKLKTSDGVPVARKTGDGIRNEGAKR